MGKVLRIVAEVALAVAVVALIATTPIGLGILAGAGIGGIGPIGALSVSQLFLGAAALNVAANALDQPKPLTMVQQFSSTAIDFTGDPWSPIPYAIGRTATAGKIVKVGNSGIVITGDPTDHDKPNYYLHYHTVLSTGPIDSFEQFYAERVVTNFDSDGSCTSAPYATFMWMAKQIGSQPQTAMTQPIGSLDNSGAYPGWTSAHKLNGLAAYWWILAAEPDPYSTGQPGPLWVGKWVMAYDPRLDSTQTGIGGSGAQRIGDETTWTWSDNPHLHALTYAIGRYQQGKRIIGVGCPPANLDIAAYANAANVADANAWKAGGVVTSADDKWNVLQQMHQAGGGKPLQLRASLSCYVQAPRVSIATITGADVVGTSTAPRTRTRRERLNQIIPTYRSEAHDWQQVAAEPILVAAYQTLDRGELRSREVVYPLVQGVNQAAQLARYDIENSREIGPITLQVRPYLIGIRPGDCVTLDIPELALVSQKCVLTNRIHVPETGALTWTLFGETDAKHTAALAQTGVAPPVPAA